MKKILYLLILLSLAGCFKEDMDEETNEHRLDAGLDLADLEKNKIKIDMPLVSYDEIDEDKIFELFDLKKDEVQSIDEDKNYKSINWTDGTYYFSAFPDQYISFDRNNPIDSHYDLFEVEENQDKDLGFLKKADALAKTDSALKDLGFSGYRLSYIYGVEKKDAIETLKNYEANLLEMMDGKMPEDYTSPDYEDLEDTYIIKYIKEFDGIPSIENQYFNGQNLLMTYTSQLTFRLDESGIYYFEASFPCSKSGERKAEIYDEEGIKRLVDHKIKGEMFGFEDLDISLVDRVFATEPVDQKNLDEIEIVEKEIPLNLYYKFKLKNNNSEEVIFINGETGEADPWIN